MGWTSTEFAENTASRPGKVFPLVTLALLAALLAFSRDCYAVDVIAAQRLARQSACVACHSVYQK